MENIKLRNSIFAILYCAFVLSFYDILLMVISIVGSSIVKEYEDIVTEVIVFGIIFGVVWLFSCFAMLLSKTVVITNTEIKMYRKKKLKWCIKKEEIVELVYNRAHWYDFIDPISSINAFALQFKLVGESRISKKSCSLSSKQIKKIKEKFDYPFREIGSIYEQ